MIYGEQIRLRGIEQADLENFVAWMNDPQVRHGLQLYLPLSSVQEQKWFEGLLKRDPCEVPLSIDVRQGEDWIHAGSCGLHQLDWQARSAMLGISIGRRDFWSQGYGTDVVRTLLRHGFETLNLHRVGLDVFQYNSRAIGLYRRVGFVEEGRRREARFFEGQYYDVILMGILRSEWLEARRV